MKAYSCLVILMMILGLKPALAVDRPVLRIDPGGHMAVIWRVAFTSDGRHVISAGEDKIVRVWDLETGKTKRSILGWIGPGQWGKIFGLALSPDDSLLAVGGIMAEDRGDGLGAGSIRLHHFASGEIKTLLKGHTSAVIALDFSSDGLYLASGAADRTVRLWDLAGKPRQKAVLVGHEDFVSAVSFSPDGRRLVSASYDGTLRLWRTENGVLLKVMTGHRGQIWTAAYSPDGRYIVSAGYSDKKLKLWDGESGEFIKDLAELEQGPPGLCFSPDGTRVVVGAQEGRGDFACQVYKIPSGDLLNRFTGHHSSVKAVAVSPDGRRAVSGGGINNEIYVWSLETAQPEQRLAGDGAPVWSVGFSADGGRVAWGDRYTQPDRRKYGPLKWSLQLKDGPDWDVCLGEKVLDESRFSGAVHQMGPHSLQVRRGGRYGWANTLQVLKNNKVIQEIVLGPGSGDEHRCFTFTPDGSMVITGGNNGVLAAYDLKTGKKVSEFVGHESEVWAVAVSSDGRLLVSGSNDQTFRLWDLTGLRNRLITHPLLSVFVGLDRQWVAWTPRGYYVSSVQGDRYVGWHVNRGPEQAARFYPAMRFMDKFYRQDVVAAVLETGQEKEGISRAGRKKNAETDIDVAALLPPAVIILEPRDGQRISGPPGLTVKGVIQSVTGEPVIDVTLLHNGRSVLDRDLIPDQDQTRQRVHVERRIELEPGENILTLTAAGAQARSNPETVKITYKPLSDQDRPAYKPDLYLLAVGVSRYKDTRLNLEFAHQDALSLAEILEGQSGGLYGRIRSKVLIDDEATRSNVLDGLDWLLSEATQKDVAVLFIAGHGVNDNRGGYYFVAHDTDPLGLRSTGVRWFDFQDVLTGVPAKTILMADTCHSGSVTGSRRKTRGAADITRAIKELIASDSGVVVLTAATGREASQESPEWGNGAFTKALLEALQGQADHDKNGVIDLKEIDFYITYRVKELTGGSQHPTTEIPRSMPNFPVALKR